MLKPVQDGFGWLWFLYALLQDLHDKEWTFNPHLTQPAGLIVPKLFILSFMSHDLMIAINLGINS